MTPCPPAGHPGSDGNANDDSDTPAHSSRPSTSVTALDLEQLQALNKRLLAELENERYRLSRELHDEIGQAITAIKLCALSLRLPGDDPERRTGLDEIVALADHSLAGVRALSLRIRPPQLDSLGLEAALRWQVGVLFQERPEAIALDIATLPTRASREVELACFRIAQESLGNCIDHARATRIEVGLGHGEGQLHLHIHDDGCGFLSGRHRGTGLALIRLRAQLVGGTAAIESTLQEGTRIFVRLPFPTA